MACLVTENAAEIRACDAMTVAAVASPISGSSAHDGAISAPVSGLPEVLAQGQGGLLDVALSPTFAEDRTLYWSYAKPLADGTSATAAARGRLAEDAASVTDVQDVFVQQPPSPTTNHYGSRVVPDGAGHLFVTTGEHFSLRERQLAQDLATTYGKVVRVNLDGTPPADNPFTDAPGAIPTIWSLGHRNIQAAALDAEGRLWTVEHGPQGGDELNRIEPGLNYGWPVISYGQNYNGSPVGEGITAREGLEQPVYYWDPVIAPSGMAFCDGAMFPEWQGDLFIGGLSSKALVRVDVNGMSATKGDQWPMGTRIRDVDQGPDGAIWVLEDGGRGSNGKVLKLTRP